MKDACLKYADYILVRAKELNKKIRNSMVHKILFYAYIEYARDKSKPMFDDKFYAWERGPILQSVYSKYITLPFQDMVVNDCNEKISEEKKIYLDRAFDLLINKDIMEIIEKTKANNKGPWKSHYIEDIKKIFISDDDAIPFAELYDFYSINENYNYLIKFEN